MTLDAAIYGKKFEDVRASLNDLLCLPAIKDGALAVDYHQEIEDFNKRGFLTVAFIGEYSAGKSTIISALTGIRDIKISADIATDATTEYPWHGIHIVDTPGLWTERQDHDLTTLDAIARADLLVYCLTYSLFDTTTLASFRKLSYELNYQKKMMLLINKMSAEAGDDEAKICAYTDSLTSSLLPNAISDFPVYFCDARDYIDGKETNDAELIELSRFNSLMDGLNRFVSEKGAMARLDTPLRISTDYLNEASDAALRSDSEDGAYSQMLTRLSKSIERNRRELRGNLSSEMLRLEDRICKLGRELAQDIGISTTLENDLKNAPKMIGSFCSDAASACEVVFKESEEKLREDLEKDFNSPLMGALVTYSEARDKYIGGTGSETAHHLNSALVGLNQLSQKLGTPIRALAKAKSAKDLLNPVNSPGTSLSTSMQVSGSIMHTGVKSIGGLIGYKFRPWEAVNIAKNAANFMVVAGAVISIFSLISGFAEEAELAENERKISQAKKDLNNQFQNDAADIIQSFQTSFSENEKALFDNLNHHITSIRQDYEKEMAASNSTIAEIGRIRLEINSLLTSIN